jgi:rubrerythrin
MKETSVAVDHLLEICRRIEFTLASLYRYLGELHWGTTDIAAILIKTANEEENHARQFEFALKLPNLIAHPKVDVYAADGLLKDVLDLDKRVRQTPTLPVDALQAAVEIEERLASYHMNSIGIFHDPKLQQLFDAMMAADKQHAQTITQALARLTSSGGAQGQTGSDG